MAKDKQQTTKTNKLTISAREIHKKSRNEMHLHHRLNASGTGAHKNMKRYRRRRRHKLEYGEE